MINKHPPLFILYPVDTNSENHRLNCLALHLVRDRDIKQSIEFMSKQTPQTRKKLHRRILRVRAFDWLKNQSRPNIRESLARLPEAERGPMRDALNEQDQQIKNHQPGATYE